MLHELKVSFRESFRSLLSYLLRANDSASSKWLLLLIEVHFEEVSAAANEIEFHRFSMTVKSPLISKAIQIRGGFIGNIEFPNAEKVFEVSSGVINTVGGTLLVIACFAAIVDTVKFKYAKLLGKESDLSLEKIRLDLGQLITYSLELLVAADVIETLTAPSHSYHIDTLYKIGLIVAIRTVLSHFLGKELDELENKLEQRAEAKKRK
jgi:uncharacterized membrane protein